MGDVGSGGACCELRHWGGTVQALWLWARQGVFHLPRAQQEASAELCGFQKETPQPSGWC